jgi:hypothetical protein
MTLTASSPAGLSDAELDALPGLLTTEEVAALTRTTPATVRWRRHVGRGPVGHVIPGTRRVLYPRDDVLTWLAESVPA